MAINDYATIAAGPGGFVQVFTTAAGPVPAGAQSPIPHGCSCTWTWRTGFGGEWSEPTRWPSLSCRVHSESSVAAHPCPTCGRSS